MKITNLLKSIVLLLLLSGSGKALAQTLVHYWNFNNNSSQTTLLTPNTMLVPGASITHVAGGISAIDVAGGTGQNFNVANPNARNGDTSGTHLRFNDPIGGQLVFALPTTGYADPIVKFACRRSGSGAGTQYWDYTLNGTTYVPFDTLEPFNGDPIMETLNFSSIPGADNNPNFKIRVSFAAGPGGTVGNNRFDNFSVDASAMSPKALVHYWNFNNNASQTTLFTPTVALVSGASITHITGGTSSIDVAGGTGQNFTVTNPNARNGDTAGAHLRFNNPIGGGLQFDLPTTGYQSVMVKYGTRRSGSGAGLQYWSYTTNGTTYIPFDTVVTLDADPVPDSFNFSAITAVNNNPNFKLRVAFAAGAGGTGGNNRIDNFTLDAYPMVAPDNNPPVATFNPVASAVNVAVNVTPAINFNEPIRLLNNSAITSGNVGTLVELRLNNASGTMVPFTAAYANNSITITPTTALANNQQYYVALLGNMVEDTANNAVATLQSAQFTTIMQQTQFAVGDMAFVAYRMNATSTDDEVALLTFKDILPGTFINLTDAKYTSNTQPQCAGGIVWTAPLNTCVPSGTVIRIKTEALTANIGTVTGAGFGLSSSGDQVIVYTGTPAAPNYITAITSNDWATTNTTCSGSLSMRPAVLTDGTSSVNLSTAPGNTTGNSVNAYYNGTQTGTAAQLKTAILNPANWLAVAAGTAPQTWPNYSFPAPPMVTAVTITSSTTVQLVFNADLTTSSAQNTANYTGIPGLASATVTSNGAAIDTVTLTYSTAFSNGSTYNLTVQNITNTANQVMPCAYTLSFTYTSKVSFASSFVVTQEGAGTLNFIVNLANPGVGSIDLEVKGYPYSTATTADFTMPAMQTLQFTGSTNTITVPITISDDQSSEQSAEYFVLAFKNPVGVQIVGDTMATVYIKDNDNVAPVAGGNIKLQYVGSFDPSGSNDATCEVVAYDSASKRLFTTSAITKKLDIVNFADPKALALVSSIDLSSYGDVTSVAVKNGIVAVASPNTNQQLDGSVLFFDINGAFQKQVTVGALPDMITFTPDGMKVLTANEGQPNDLYTVDPEGTVSIIDISGGIAGLGQGNVNTIGFNSLNSVEAVYIASGVRKLKATSTLSQDLEPEYITISSNSKTAWVTLQENNAMAEIDLASGSLVSVWPLGTKNLSLPGNGIDASDNNDSVLVANWPLKAFFIPDAVASYNVNGSTYLITANEGDEKEYGGLNERTTVGATTYKLDPATFPNASVLKKNHNLGRMRVTALNGDKDNDGDYDEIYSVGTRSFTIWNPDSKSMVYDSGDDFEAYTSTAPSINPIFNADNEDNVKKGRSRAKGPEPEGIAMATLSNKSYVFVTLERVGGVMVYDVTNPAAPVFNDYKNSRSVSAYTGDHGPECLVYIPNPVPKTNSHIVVANEISGTLSVYEVVDNTPDGISDPSQRVVTFNVFPNPANQSIVYFNRIADVQVTDIAGKRVFAGTQVLKLDVSNYPAGVYLIETADGASAKLVVTK